MVTDNAVRLTSQLLKQVFEFKIPTDALLSKFFRDNRKLGMKDRGFIAETTYTILRNYYKLTKVVNPQNTFLLIGYTLIKLMGVPRHEIRELKTINLGEVDKLPELDLEFTELPGWLIEKLSNIYSIEEIKLLSQAMTKQAPLTLRVNSLKANVKEVISNLEQIGIKAKPTNYSPYGIKLPNKASLMNNELFLNGVIEVQDEASQLAGMLLDPKRGEMVADFCAGSGGKTLLFGMLMKNSGRIYAFDINERRLGNFSPRLARSGLSNVYAQVIANENDSKIKRLSGKMDRVFVDAPCLGLGTLRRNPDLKFRYNLESLQEITPKQLSILTAASKMLKPGGRLVYATCSILPDENQAIISEFLAQNNDFELVEINQVIKIEGLVLKDQRYLELNPKDHDTDGFFACVLHKKAE